MRWKEIEVDNLPEGEILAANFKKGTMGYKEKHIGYLSETTNNVIVCSSEDTELYDCTHYIDLHSFDDNIHTKIEVPGMYEAKIRSITYNF